MKTQLGSNLNSSMETTGRLSRIKPYLPKLALAVVVIIVLVLAARFLIIALSGSKSSAASDSRINLPGPRATSRINREVDIPIKDDKGKELTRLKYLVDTAELRDQIIVSGQKATAVSGRVFLILNIKIVNSYSKGIDINSKDFVRLAVNGNTNEWMAPKIHNDPITVQAISTENVRLGFAISDSDKNLLLQIGEVNGSKQVVPIKF